MLTTHFQLREEPFQKRIPDGGLFRSRAFEEGSKRLSHLLATEGIGLLVGETGCRVIVDHHAVREPRFREHLAKAFDTGRVVTAAEYLGRRDECLEAWRAALWARRRRERSDARDATGAP